MLLFSLFSSDQWCLRYCTTAVKRLHVQGTLKKKAFNWGFVYSFRGWVRDHHDGEHGSMQADMTLEQRLRAYIWCTGREEKLVVVWAFETSKSTPSDMPPPRGPHFLIHPNQPTTRDQTHTYINSWSWASSSTLPQMVEGDVSELYSFCISYSQ